MSDTFAGDDPASMPKNRAARQSAWRIMHPVRGQIRLAMLLSALSTLLMLATLFSLAMLVPPLLQHPDRWPVVPLLVSTGCLTGAYLLRLLAFNQSHYAAFRLEVLLREQLATHVTRIPLGTAQRFGSGALTKILLDDVKALHVYVADSTPLYARALVAPAGTLLLLLWLDWRLALAALAVLLAGMLVLILAMGRSAPMNQRYNQAREQVGSAVIEFVQAMPVVRTFDAGSSAFGRYQQALDGYLSVLTAWYRQAGFSARFSFAVLNPLPTLLVLLGAGYALQQSGALDIGRWVAVLLLGCGMAEAMMPLMMLNHMVAKAKVSIARIQDVLDIPALPLPATDVPPADASVTFEGVSFHYDAQDVQPVLQDVSFHAPAGSITALVGRSGAGKSTVTRLIPRFWDVSAGRILIGGVDIRAMATDTLMRQVAFVFQENMLFADSIANNIRLGQPDAPMEAVIAAARAAQAHAFIQALPQGYDTPAGELGQALSGGQRQRIAIARALLQNRPILVLDEATAYADPENEAALVQALAALMRGKTVIMVAHRLATVRDADRILVFERGRLSEQGDHAALLAAQGGYARLWQHDQQAQSWSLRQPTINPDLQEQAQ